jgi:hypothetical protein
VRHKNDFRAEKGGSSYVFNDVVVITDQDTAFPAIEVKDTILISRREIRIDKGMELSEFSD